MAKQKKEKEVQNIDNRNLVNRIPSLMQYNEGSDRSKYDTTGITPLEEQRGQKQGLWDSAANITGRLIGRAGLSAVETVGMLGYGLPKAVVTGDMNAIFDNELTDKFKTFDDALVKSTPFYQTKGEQEASLFSKQYLTSTNFWGNLLGEGGGFVAGAVLGGGLIGKGIGLAGRAARAAGILAAEGEKVAEVASAAKSGNILDKLISFARSSSAKNTAQYYTQRIGGNMYEAGVEARGIKEEILRAKEEEFKSMYPYATPTEAQKAEWEDIANTYSNAGFGLNLGLLMIDGFNASKFIKGYKNTNRTVNALREGGQYVEKGKYGKIFDRLKVATGGPLSEMAQEGGQFLTEKTTTDLAAKTKTRNTELDFNEYFLSTMKGLEETFGTKEGQESMLAGFLLAAPTNIYQAVKEGSLDKDGIAILNKYITKDTFQKVLNYNSEAYENGSGESRDDAAYSNSKLTYETLQRKDWMKYVKSRDDAGRFDDVLDDIARERKAPLEVFNQIHGTDFNEEKRQKKLVELEKQAMFYKRTAENIEGSFTRHPAKEGIVETSVDINNYNERIRSLEGKKLDPSLDEATRSNIITELEILKNDKKKADYKLASLLTGKPYVDEVEQAAAIPNQGDIVSVNNSPAVVEGILTPEPAVAAPENVVLPKPAEEVPVTAEEVEAVDALPPDTNPPANPPDNNNVAPNPPAPANPEVPPTVSSEDTTLIVSTPEGKQQIFPHEIEEEFMDDENLLDSPEESLFTEVNNPSSEFTEDIPRDLSKGEKGKSLVIYEKDANGNPTTNIAYFLNYSDWNNQDHEVNYNQAKGIKVNAKQLAENRTAKELIIDKEETLTYHMVKQTNGNLQLIATDKDGKDYDIGYFLNPDVNKASRGSKVNPEITLSQFVSNYQGVHLEIAQNLLTALTTLVKYDSFNVTDYIKLSSVVDNVGGQTKTLLKNAFGSKFANRWLIDGEFVVAMNNNGNYVAIDGLSKEKTDLLYSQLESSKAVNSLGTQYVALVKRPDSNAYQFIGLKGRQHNQTDIDGFKAEIEKYRNNPNLDIKNLVNNLNNQIFIPSNKTATIDGKEIPLHYKFAFKKNRELIVIGVPKIINGLEQNVKLPRPSRMTVEEALSAASVRVGKTTKEAVDREAIIQNTQTSAKPEIWRTFFAFDSMKFLENIPQQTSNIIDTPTTDAVEEVTPVVSDVEPAKDEVSTVAEDARNKYKKTGVGGKNIKYSPIAETTDPRIIAKLEEIKVAIKKLINVDVDFFDNDFAHGAFTGSVILLNRGGWKRGTEWHEAFHAVFSVLPKEEQTKILAIAYKQLGVSQEEIDNLREVYAKGGDVADDQFLFEKVLEEKVADMFQDYMNGQPTTLFGAFFQKFKNLIKMLLGIVERDEFKALFKNIQGGKYAAMTPSGEVKSYSLIDGASALETNHVIRYLTTMYLNREDIDKALGTTSRAELRTFIAAELEKMRNNSARINNERIDQKEADLKNAFDNKLITQKELKDSFDNFYAQLYEKNIEDEKGRVYSAYLSPENEELTVAQVIRHSNLRRVEDIEEDDDVAENRDFSASELEKSPQDTKAAQYVKDTISSLYYIKDGEVIPLNYVEVFNNLLLNFSGINNKTFVDPVTDKLTDSYEQILLKLTKTDSDLSLSLKSFYNLYKADEHFKNNCRVAFQRSFTNAYNILVNAKSSQDRYFVRNANNKDYVVKQVELWKSQILSKKINGGIIPNATSLYESIGIVIEPDTLINEEAIIIINRLANDVRGLKDNIIVVKKDEEGNTKNAFNASILEGLTNLAQINITKRLDLGELNFKNAKGKSMHSMMQNSWVLDKLRSLGKTFGIFTGNNFYGDRMDYSDLDPKTYFSTLMAMYLNTESNVRKPFFTIQQFEAKSTVPVVQGTDYSDITEEDFKKLIESEQARQNINFIKAKNEISTRTKRNLVEGYHYFQSGKEVIDGQEVKTVASRKIMDKYKELTGNEFTNSREEILQLVSFAEQGQLERKFLPRAFTYTNLPYFNEVKNPQYNAEAFTNLFTQERDNIKEFMSQFNITFEDLNKQFNLEGMTEESLLSNFIVSNYLNKMQILAEISPDLNQFKDFTDITKRGAGLLASGPNHGEGTFKFAIVPDSKLDFIANGNNMSAEELDAQGMETIKERINRFIKLGIISKEPNTKNPKSDAAYQRYLILQAYLNDDTEWIESETRNHDAVLKVDKTVGYGEEFYIKTAVYASVRYFHSRQVKEGTAGSFKDTDNGKSYLPMPGREYEWNLMNEMQAKGISSLFAKSAVKKGARSVAQDVDGKLSLSPLTFNYLDYRLQQENPSGKVKIKDGTQLRQLLEAGFDPYYKINDGRSIMDVITVSDTLLAEITRFNTMLYGVNKVYDINGKKINPFTTYLRNSLESSATTDRMLEFFESKEGEFTYSPSMPMMKIKFEELLLSYFNSNVASQKTPGLKSTIISSKYYKTMELNGKVITSYEYNNLPENLKAQVTTRDLNYSNPKNKLSEIVLSEEYLDNLGITIKEWVELKRAFEKAERTGIQTEESRLFDKISTVLCYRIPTQAQQSMMPSRVIDFLPRHYGSTAIPPAQITKMSGADYDVDSLFIQRHAVYRDKKGKLKSFGTDKESLKKSLAKNSFISDMVKEVELSPEKIALEKELSRAESKLRRLLRELSQPSNPEIRKSIKMEINLQRDMIKTIEGDIENLEEADAFTQVMGSITGKTGASLDEILDGANDMDFTVVEKNFNDVLDNRIAVLTSDEGIKLLNSPAEDLFKDLYTKFFKDIFSKEDNYPVYSGADTQLLEWLKVAVGSKSISGSANLNKISGFLVKNNVPLTEDYTKVLKSIFNINFSSNDPSQKDIVLEKYGNKIQLKYEKDEDGNLTNIKVIITGPKSDLLSSNVTLSVDNAKDQRLIEFNLNDKNMAHASTMAALGMGTQRLATLLLNPVSKMIASKLQLNAGFGKEVDKISTAVRDIFSGIPTDTKKQPFTDEDLIDGINNYDEIMDVLTAPKANVVIVSDPWQAQADGKGISVIRGKSENHYGNPFGDKDSSAAVIMEGSVTDRVNAFRSWLNGTAHQEVEPKRREWILSQISKGKLDGKTLLYYKNLSEASHADVIAEMVNFRKFAENPELLKMVQKQMAIGDFYTVIGAITDDNFTINTVLNFNKEVGRNGSDITKIQFALKRMQSDKFCYETDNIFNNPMIMEIERTCMDLKRNLSQQLLSYNHNIIKTTNQLLSCTERNSLEQRDNLFQKELNDQFVEYLGMKAYSIYKPVVNLMTPSTVMGPEGEFEETFSITDTEIINGNKVIAEYERILEYMTAMKFPIASLFSIQEPTVRYPFRRLGINTFTNLSSEDKQKLIDSFDEVLADPVTETLGKYIITHIAAHDNFKYIANSLVDKARPVYFTSLNRVYKGMEGFDGMEQVFSMNQNPDVFKAKFQEFFQGNIENYVYDFGKFFFSDIRNAMQLNGPNKTFMSAIYDGDNKKTFFSLNKEKDTFFFNIPQNIDRETMKFPYFFRTGKSVYTISNITADKIVYSLLPVIQSDKSIALKLYQLDYNTFVRFINAALTNKTLEDDAPAIPIEDPSTPQIEVPTPDEISESKKETVNPVETLTEETGDIPEVILPSNTRKSTTYKYFGAWYTIILEGNKAVDVQNYKGSLSKKQKLIDAFNLNPDVDPQTGIRFRGNDILGGINFEAAKQETLGMDEYELFPGVFANEGQKVAIDKIKSYLSSSEDEFLLKGRGGTGKTTIIRKALEPFKRSKIIGATVADEARGVLQENMKAYDTFTVVSMLGLVADNDEDGNLFFREKNAEEQEAFDRSFRVEPIKEADVVIIDEASMIDKFLYDLILSKKKPSAKIIFMGDNAQIAPIEGGESPVFDLLNKPNHAILTERMRQAGESPILPITDVYADNIEKIQNNQPGVKNPLTNRVDNFNSADNEGVLFINSNKDLINMFVKDFENDPGFKSNIIVAATNKIVDAVNTAVRKEIFGDNIDSYVVGDIVRLNTAHVVDGQKIHSNGVKGKVTSVEKMSKEGLPFEMYSLKVTTEKFDKGLGKFVEEEVTFKTISNQDKPAFKTYLKNLAQKAKTKEISWREFYTTKESVMDVGYNYALTSHKVQGSTYRNVYVVEDDIMSFPDTIERVNRMMYTAVSRPSKKLVIYSTSNPKTNIINTLVNKSPVAETQPVVEQTPVTPETVTTQDDNSIVDAALNKFMEEDFDRYVDELEMLFNVTSREQFLSLPQANKDVIIQTLCNM